MDRGHNPDHAAGKSLNRSARKAVAAILFCFLPVSAYAFQHESQNAGSDLQKYGPLINEINQLKTKLAEGVQLPAPRTQSRLLPLLPASTSIYFAIPNYGDALYQADQIFHQQLQDSPVLNEHWQQLGMATFIIEGAIDKVHQFSQYIGNEIAVSGTFTQKGGSFLLVAEVKKPGLKAFLTDAIGQFGGGKNSGVMILTPQELVTAKAPRSGNPLVVLVRPDFLVISSDLAKLRTFNTQLVQRAATFAGTAFGQRLNQAYQQGVGVLFGANLQEIQNVRPKGPEQNEATLKQTGFADVKFLIAQYKSAGGHSASDAELSFNGPRQGIAGWLAAPGPIGALDFVSTSAGFVGAALLKSPSQMFSDIMGIAESGNPVAAGGLAQTESELHINFKQDVFDKLLGDIAVALDGPASEKVAPWKAMIKVSDAPGLQQTITKLIAAVNAKASDGKTCTLDSKVEAGQTYYRISFAKGEKNDEVDYAFADGYLIAGASHEIVAKAIETHHGGTSLGRSSELHAALPQGHSADCSAISYQNPNLLFQGIAPLVPELRSFSGELGDTTNAKPAVTCLYGEPTAIRASSNSPAYELAMVALPTAALAIPNLMRRKEEASDPAAAATIRTLNVAQMQYSIDHPDSNFAPTFAALGQDSPFSSAKCETESLCVKGSYRFSIVSSCENHICRDYLVAATPLSPGKEHKSFCSTSDGVVRFRIGTENPRDAEECQKWEPL